MDVNTNLNIITAVNTANAANQNQPAAAQPPANQNNNGLIGGQEVPRDILDLSGSRPRSEVNMRDINAALNQHNQQVESFRAMIERLLHNQASTVQIVDGVEMIEIDEATRAQAQADIAEDGYFGVEQTSERILAFARAFAGDDVERMGIMRDAFLAGFAAAERAWGGELPEISGLTRDAVLRGFDEMMGITPPAEA